MEQYDLVVIGSGPGGYVAAIRSAQLGYKTALVEKYDTLGGTCTNVGCIPTKAILDSTHHYHDAQHHFAAHGIQVAGLSIDFGRLYERKDKVVLQNTQGLNFLMKKNKVTVIHGTASFVNNSTVEIATSAGERLSLGANKFIIATGSKPATIPGITIDKKRIISSTEALSLPEKPGKIVIIGGGVIGVEMASIFNRMGCEVTIIEYADRLLANMDHELGDALKKILLQDGIKILLKQAVYKTENEGSSASVFFRDSDGHGRIMFWLLSDGKPLQRGLGWRIQLFNWMPEV
jgi:dihydrolipoamide dehydrogenase